MRGLKFFRDVGIVSHIYWTHVKANILLNLLIALLIPLCIAFMCTLIIGELGQYQKIILYSGILTTSVMGGSLNCVGQQVATDKGMNTLKLFVVRPVHPLSYALGILFGANATLYPSLLAIFGLGAFWGIRTNVNVLISLIIGFLCFVGFAFALGVMFNELRNAMTALNTLTFLLIFLAPVYYPLENAPTILRSVSLALPTTYLAESIRIAIGGGFPIVHWFILLAFLVGSMSICFFRLRWVQK